MRARSHSGCLRLWPFLLEMVSVRARSHSERFNSLSKLIISIHILLLSTLNRGPPVSTRQNINFSKKWLFRLDKTIAPQSGSFVVVNFC